ncbi:GNAT family N-acetyltransferase [Nocardioides sp. B-3]|uniref:GNAT family N-acetyltransferase n=1 Tax=Nocardioides sp. B-3 TaxID=2895565 RepID=UPI002153A120|nr:GNAT family N-acetyltransferase [Nocardioides sp. B-3]UUZ58537.1 GNAT family N-acetyltransferase [Nocardioides sp. B-3]
MRSAGDLLATGGGYLPPEPPDVMTVWGMWTAPEARGRGHGRALLTRLLDWAHTRSISIVELHVTEGNDTARRLYESCGFVATGEWQPLREGSPLRVELLRRAGS